MDPVTLQYLILGFVAASLGLSVFFVVQANGRATSSPQPEQRPPAETFDRIKNLETTCNHLELEIEELREFIQRGMKRMSARHQRAESIAALLDDAEQIDQEAEEVAGNGQAEMFDPNGPKPRLVRKGK